MKHIRKLLSDFDAEIENIPIQFGPERIGDIKHSLASVHKIERLLIQASHNVHTGMDEAISWYWEYFKSNSGKI